MKSLAKPTANSYSQEQNQALFAEYLDSLQSCFNTNGDATLAIHLLDKLHGFLTAPFPNMAVVSSDEARACRNLIQRVENKVCYGYNERVQDRLYALKKHLPPVYNSDWGTDYNAYSGRLSSDVDSLEIRA